MKWAGQCVWILHTCISIMTNRTILWQQDPSMYYWILTLLSKDVVVLNPRGYQTLQHQHGACVWPQNIEKWCNMKSVNSNSPDSVYGTDILVIQVVAILYMQIATFLWTVLDTMFHCEVCSILITIWQVHSPFNYVSALDHGLRVCVSPPHVGRCLTLVALPILV